MGPWTDLRPWSRFRVDEDVGGLGRGFTSRRVLNRTLATLQDPYWRSDEVCVRTGSCFSLP